MRRLFRRSPTPPRSEPAIKVSRKCACGGVTHQAECDTCAAAHGSLQRHSASEEHQVVPPVVSEVLSGAGRPLDASTRAAMEPRFGRDFSHVRIHDDAQAGQSAKAVAANAYTVGPRIVFDAGRYRPGAPEGQRLLAHELTHVVQHAGQAPAAAGELAIDESPAREEEADAVAGGMSRNPSADSMRRAAGPGAIQRQQTAASAASSSGNAAATTGGAAAASTRCIEDVVGEDPLTLTEAGTVTIVEFSSPGCNPCRMLRASLEDMCRVFAVRPPAAPVRMFSIDIAEEANEEIGRRYTNGSVPWIYFYVGGQQKAAYNTALQPDALDQIVGEYTEEASQSGAWKGFKSGAKWGGLIGGGLGILGAIGVAASDLEGNAMMLGMLGSVAGGVLAGAAIGGGIGALHGALTEEKKGSRRRRRRPQPKRRAGLQNEPDELEADTIALRALQQRGDAGHRPSESTTASNGGAPMDVALRSDMESRFGRDFGDVRVHRDAAAHRVADSMQAYAVTEGSDIYFARDSYAPHTPGGRAILAHELAHVVQQDVPGTSAASSLLESEATRASAEVVRGQRPQVQHGAPGGAPLPITRAEKTALWSAIGAGAGAATGALVGLLVASQMKDQPFGAAAGYGALIGGGLGLIGGFLGGFFSRRTERVGAAEADMLIRRRYGQYLPTGVPAPLRNAIVKPVSSAEVHERFECRHGQDEPRLVAFTDTGAPWKAAEPPAAPIASAADEPVCHGQRMEHATPERPVIYYPRDTTDAGLLVHEGLHAMAHPEFQRLHNYVVEGATEMYTRRLLSDVNIEPTPTEWERNAHEVERFESIVGEEMFARAYFSGDVAALDRSATAIFGPCSLKTWALALQVNGDGAYDAEDVLANRGMDHCNRLQHYRSLLPVTATPTPPPGTGGGGSQP